MFLLYPLFGCFWLFAITFYALKFFFPSLDLITSYGKFHVSTTRNLLYPVSNRVAWCMFYGVGWCWNACLLYFGSDGMKAISNSYIGNILGFPQSHANIPLQFNIMMQVQLTRRFCEALFIQKFSDQRMHVIPFIAALSFYIFECSTVIVEVLGTSVEFGSTFSSLISCLLFAIGSVIQHKCHVILAGLRDGNTKENSKTTQQYSIPYGNLFEYVSCPHYLAEICIYSSFVILTQGRLIYVWLIFAFVVENLAHSALRTHRWYLTKFKKYPAFRKALIPYLL